MRRAYALRSLVSSSLRLQTRFVALSRLPDMAREAGHNRLQTAERTWTYGQRTRVLTEPQLVAKLLERFPANKQWIAICQWMPTLPDALKEALVPYGGLCKFASGHSNWFTVRKENGVNVIYLSSMSSQLRTQRARREKEMLEKSTSYHPRSVRGGAVSEFRHRT